MRVLVVEIYVSTPESAEAFAEALREIGLTEVGKDDITASNGGASMMGAESPDGTTAVKYFMRSQDKPQNV